MSGINDIIAICPTSDFKTSFLPLIAILNSQTPRPFQYITRMLSTYFVSQRRDSHKRRALWWQNRTWSLNSSSAKKRLDSVHLGCILWNCLSVVFSVFLALYAKLSDLWSMLSILCKFKWMLTASKFCTLWRQWTITSMFFVWYRILRMQTLIEVSTSAHLV